MVDQVEIKEAETTAEKPEEQVVEQSKPEGLPEKFNSVEDLAKSYAELEKKLGGLSLKKLLSQNKKRQSLMIWKLQTRLQKLQALIYKTCNLSLITQAN